MGGVDFRGLVLKTETLAKSVSLIQGFFSRPDFFQNELFPPAFLVGHFWLHVAQRTKNPP